MGRLRRDRHLQAEEPPPPAGRKGTKGETLKRDPWGYISPMSLGFRVAGLSLLWV